MRFLSSEILDQFVDNTETPRPENLRYVESCPACRSARSVFLFQKYFFKHWRCKACGLIFVNPRPGEDDLIAMYSHVEYFANRTRLFEIARIRDGRSFDITMNVAEWYDAIVQRIKRYTAGGAMLDVGGGSGRFLKFVKDNYPEFEPTLVEVNEELCRVARDVFGLEAHNGTVEQLALSGRKFDAVVSIATIEHIFDPASYLATIRSAMNARAVLYITGPRLGPLTRTLTTSAAYDVIPPAHLNFFDKRSLGALVRTNDIALTIADTFQSHGPVFHFGHVFCKQNYMIEDVVMEDAREDPLRVYPYRDNSRLTNLVCNLLDAATRVLTPVIRLVDGQRVGQFLLRAT